MMEKFRISDIFKKSKQERRPAFRGIKFAQPKQEETRPPERQPQYKTEVSPPRDKVVEKQEDVVSKDNIGEGALLYSESVIFARKIYKEQSEIKNIPGGVYVLVKRMIDLIEAGDRVLLKTAMGEYGNLEEYLYYHVVNVCIISLHIGQGLSYVRPYLIDLGIAAFLHDIGLTNQLDIINQPKALKPQEYEEVKQHPTIGQEILGKVSNNLNEKVFAVIRQEHERIDGSGYPTGLEENEIIEYAQIVGLSDVYEAVTHPRPYRVGNTPLEAIKMLLDDKCSFPHGLIKVLIERIGIFPVGTFVKLNTREIGEVIKGNIESPLRPTVNIMFDAASKRLKQSRQIDLADNPTVYISGVSPAPR